jgi:outer membrane lipoprotein SlyB
MKVLFGILLCVYAYFSFAHDNHTHDEPAKLLKKVQVCEKVQIPVYGMIERPASSGEVFSGLIIGGLIGDQFGSGSGNDAMTFLGAVMGAEEAGQRKREKVIIDYKTVTQCWEEWQ